MDIKLGYQMVSWPEEDELVAEVIVHGNIVGWVKRVAGEVEIEINSDFKFRLEDFIETLSTIYRDEF